MLILDLEVIRANRFALLIGKDYGQFTICIVEVNPAGIGSIKAENLVEMFPNPVAGKMVIRGFLLQRRRRKNPPPGRRALCDGIYAGQAP